MGIAEQVRDNIEHARWVFAVLAIIVAPLAVLAVGGRIMEWRDRREARRAAAPVDYPLGRWGGSEPWL